MTGIKFKQFTIAFENLFVLLFRKFLVAFLIMSFKMGYFLQVTDHVLNHLRNIM